jgi:RNA polymerase sigma-70 factor, ECF subfamily
VTTAAAECGVLLPVRDEPRREDLAARLAADVDATYPDVVATYGDLVYSLAVRTAGPEDAEDLAAETFLRAYTALRRYPASRRRRLELRPWLVTILLNTWRNEVRSRSRRPREAPLDESVDAPSPAAGPEALAAAYDTESRLVALLGQLPDRQRLAVVLRHVGDLSTAEIGEVLGVPEGTARSHVSRGLRALRALAADAGIEELT